MHELGLAKNILDTALEASNATIDTLAGISVEVGSLSSVDIQTLRFCLETVFEQRCGKEGDVCVEFVPARVVCECGHEYCPDEVFEPCPKCGEYKREILEGKDVILESIEVDDEKDKS